MESNTGCPKTAISSPQTEASTFISKEPSLPLSYTQDYSVYSCGGGSLGTPDPRPGHCRYPLEHPQLSPRTSNTTSSNPHQQAPGLECLQTLVKVLTSVGLAICSPQGLPGHGTVLSSLLPCSTDPCPTPALWTVLAPRTPFHTPPGFICYVEMSLSNPGPGCCEEPKFSAPG